MEQYFQPGEGNQALCSALRRKFFDDLYDTIKSQVFSGCLEMDVFLETGEQVTVELPSKYFIAQHVSLLRQQTFVLVTMFFNAIGPEWARGQSKVFLMEYIPPPIDENGTCVLTPKDSRSTNAS